VVFRDISWSLRDQNTVSSSTWIRLKNRFGNGKGTILAIQAVFSRLDHTHSRAAFQSLVGKLEGFDDEQVNQLMDALHFAINRFGKKMRKDSDGRIPFLAHPIDVTRVLLDAGIDDIHVLVAATIHDVIKSIFYKRGIKKRFGQQVYSLIKELKKVKFSQLERLSDEALMIFSVCYHDCCEDRRFRLAPKKELAKTQRMVERRWKLVNRVQPINNVLVNILAVGNKSLLEVIGSQIGHIEQHWGNLADGEKTDLTVVPGWGGIVRFGDTSFHYFPHQIEEGTQTYHIEIGEDATNY